MKSYITINSRKIGTGHPTYIVAEMSANHNQDLDVAKKILEVAKESGADAVKLQTYTPDTITIDCNNEYFRIGKGTIWEGKNLFDLYGEAYTPWEWQPKLKEIAEKLGLCLFSTPFDSTAVDFLEKMNVPAYKIASFEVVDIALIRKIAKTGKPIIMSTGMAMLSEIDEAVRAIREAGGGELALLKCTSSYPAPMDEMNLRTIPHLAEAFGVPVGLSDHTLGIDAAVAAVALGATIIEKHFTLSRGIPGPDSSFSLEPKEFKAMVDAVRNVEKALGRVQYEVTEKEKAGRVFRRSLFVVKDMRMGERFAEENIRSIRPGHGLHTKFLDEVLGRRAARHINRGTPFSWDLIGGTVEDE
ncbi:MAG: pseudaminic acid synthase [Deltaproteobacteria bacterium]|nr:pseudaminic acid synthase [Deltaproteobacteria bacterium]